MWDHDEKWASHSTPTRMSMARFVHHGRWETDCAWRRRIAWVVQAEPAATGGNFVFPGSATALPMLGRADPVEKAAIPAKRGSVVVFKYRAPLIVRPTHPVAEY